MKINNLCIKLIVIIYFTKYYYLIYTINKRRMALSANAEKLLAWFDMYEITAHGYKIWLAKHPAIPEWGSGDIFPTVFEEIWDDEAMQSPPIEE